MTKLHKNDIKNIPSWIKLDPSIIKLAKRLKVTTATISYHLKKAQNNQKLEKSTWKNNHESVKSTLKNNHKPVETTLKNKHQHVNGKPFPYSATMLFLGCMLILLAINAFFLWSVYGR